MSAGSLTEIANMPRVIKHPDVRRAEMLDRALALFLQRGYDNVSLNDLIADAGVSKGAFYHWFPSKDALIAALAERSAQEQLAAVLDVLAEFRGDALGRLNAVLQAGFDVKIATAAPEHLAAMAPLLRALQCAGVRTNRRRWRGSVPAVADPRDI